MSTLLKPATERFWQTYLEEEAPDPAKARSWLYEAFKIGTTEEGADDGALLISRGIKTTTSSLLWEYEAAYKPLPKIGSLSIVENGRDEPVCVVKTTQIETKPFRDVDLKFAYDYGEWDRTLKTWRQECWQFYSAQCIELGREASHTMPLVCERFRVIYPR